MSFLGNIRRGICEIGCDVDALEQSNPKEGLLRSRWNRKLQAKIGVWRHRQRIKALAHAAFPFLAVEIHCGTVLEHPIHQGELIEDRTLCVETDPVLALQLAPLTQLGELINRQEAHR